MTATDYIFMNEAGATLTIENGTYTATKATDANGVVIYNQGICQHQERNLRRSRLYADEYRQRRYDHRER